MEDAAGTRFNDPNRRRYWMVTFVMNPKFFELSAEEQADLENREIDQALADFLARKQTAGFIHTEFRRGWIIYNAKDQAEAEQIAKLSPVFPYFDDVQYFQVFDGRDGAFSIGNFYRGLKLLFREKKAGEL